MALKSQTLLDIPNATQSIIFQNPGTVDEIDFSNNQITLKAISQYTLSKEDFLIYFNYLDIFNTALLLNFPVLNAYFNTPLPLCEFGFKVGPIMITSDQYSGPTNAISLTYMLSTEVMTFAVRPLDVIVTMQEFFTTVYILRRFTKEISLN
jgi:hypothetical protein